MHVRIDSHPDARGVAIPRRLHFPSRQVELVQKLDQWDGADHRYFKLEGDDGNLYILRFDEIAECWELIMFQRPRAAAVMPASSRSGQKS